MKWIRKGKYFKATVDGKYTVCRVNVMNEPFYEAWMARGRNSVCIAWNLKTPDEAVAECEKHAAIIAGTQEPEPAQNAR